MRLTNTFRTDQTTAPVGVATSGDNELSPEQTLAVRQAYAVFCQSVTLSSFPNGFHCRSLTLTDGTTVQMYSNNGVHQVLVVPAGVKPEEEEVASGIGVAFTQKDGAPHTGWRVGDEINGYTPQPLVFYLNNKGEWKVKKVKRLVGGNDLWVSTDRKSWYSHYRVLSSPTDVIAHIGQLPTSYHPKYYSNWMVMEGRAWMAPDDGIYSSAYVMRKNTSSFLRDNYFVDTQMFSSKMTINGQETPVVGYVEALLRKITVWRGPVISRPELEKATSLQSEDLFAASDVFEYDLANSDRVWYSTVSVNPAGTAAVVGVSIKRSPTFTDNTFVDITLGDAPTVTDAGVMNKEIRNDRSATQVVEGKDTQTFEKLSLPPQPAACDNSSSVIPEFLSGTLRIVKNTMTRTESKDVEREYYDPEHDIATGKKRVGGAFYAANGDKVVWKMRRTELGSSSTTGKYDSREYSFKTVPGFNDPNGGQTTDTVGSATKTIQITNKEEYVFPKRTITVLQESMTSTGTYVSKDWLTRFNGNVPPKIVGASDDYTSICSISSKKTLVVFYDHVTDFLVTCTEEISATVDMTWSNTNPILMSNWLSYASGSASLKLQAFFGGSEVYSVVLNSSGLTNMMGSATATIPGLPDFSNGNGPSTATSTSPFIVQKLDLLTVCDYVGGVPPAVPFAYKLMPEESTQHTYEYYNDDPGPDGDQAVAWSFTAEYDNSHERCLRARFARDPATLSIMVNVSFLGATYKSGGEDKSWWWAVSPSGVENLPSILNKNDSNPSIPLTEDLIIWEQAGIHSLVSI